MAASVDLLAPADAVRVCCRAAGTASIPRADSSLGPQTGLLDQ